MTTDTGAYVVPDGLCNRLSTTTSAWSSSFRFTYERKPLTLRQRFHLWRIDLWWALHDAMFGSHECDD